MLRGLPLNALRVALWLEMRQRANSWRAVLRNPVVLVGYGVALAALIALVVGVVWVRTAFRTPAQPSPAANEPVILVWIITLLAVTGSVVYLLIHSAFFWHRWSVGFRTSDVDFLFATPAFDLRLMRALMFTRESLWRLVAVSLSGVLIVLLFHDTTTLLALGRYYLVGGYLALSYVALRFAEYTAYRYIGLWTAVLARRVRYLSWYLTAGALVWGIAVIATLIGVIITVDLPPDSPNRTEAILGHPALRLIALPSAAAADALVAPARGLTIWIGIASLMWMGVIALCSRQVWRDVPWLRDAIAVGVQYGAARNRPHQQQSPYVLRRALEASAKPQTTATPKLLLRWSPRGIHALLWKDLLIAWRTYHPVIVLLTLAGSPALRWRRGGNPTGFPY
ncbi:MAG: hypothetical protein N2651_01485 [Fimbriimonadales bacterium]|nr:hypothetical protein [Fimbriimonadales bacterium]